MATIKREPGGSKMTRVLVYLAFATLLVVLGAVLYALVGVELLGWPRLALGDLVRAAALVWGGLVLICPLFLMTWEALSFDRAVRVAGEQMEEEAAPARAAEPEMDLTELREYLHASYGRFWRRHVRVLLVVGEADEIEALVPGLSANGGWQEGQGTLLLWGGPLQGGWASDWPTHLRELSWRRPLDGIVWALSSQQTSDAQPLHNGVRQLQTLARRLRWQAPLYLWQVCASAWDQQERSNPAVGCLLPPGASAQCIETELRRLLTPLREQGLARMNQVCSQDFLLRLSRDLNASGIARWRDVLAPLLPSFARGVPLRGLLFGLAQKPAGDTKPKNTWRPVPAWNAIREDRQAHGQAFGWTWLRGVQVAALGFAGLCVVALLLSFASNRSQIASVETALATVNTPGNLDAQLTALNTLAGELSRLEQRQQQGVPWYQRFGLSQNDALLAALWPHYAKANNALLRDVAARSLEQRLAGLPALPPDSPELTGARDPLKAYLMMAQPEKADASFLAKELAAATAERPGVTSALWQKVAPGLWTFYARHLQAHPDWRIAPDAQVIAQARQALLAQLDQPAVEQALYQRLLEDAGNQYVALRLASLVGESDATALFDTSAAVPGAFTRQAWDGYLRDAIGSIAQARQEELDWVLSDPQHPLAPELRPAALQARLTERYFQESSQAWLGFLNSIRWRKADSQAEAIGQLTLLADARRSPLVALMNALAYQGMAGVPEVQPPGKDRNPLSEVPSTGAHAPMEQTFGPLLALMGKASPAANRTASLQAYLARVTQVRSRLQQIDSAANPDAMAQSYAQAVFQGTSIETEGYGQVVATSLGAPMAAFAQNLFVLPLGQAWSGVMQSSAGHLNRQWQQEIVADWQRTFSGRYPFVANGADASLALLGQMIRPDTGRIDQFIADQLGGALHKQGKRWVPVAGESRGLRINPAFLKAINQLSELAGVLYADGAMTMSFQLKAKPVRDVVETTLIIDGVKLEYFNQMESWQAFTWPSPNDHPGVSLTWSSVRAGARLYDDYPGPWALLRLLEQARVTSLVGNGPPYQVVLTAPDGIPLTWEMRPQRGGGPLALLKLRDFKLPQEVFLGASASGAGYAAKGR